MAKLPKTPPPSSPALLPLTVELSIVRIEGRPKKGKARPP
jgi:hypothetical protein